MTRQSPSALRGIGDADAGRSSSGDYKATRQPKADGLLARVGSVTTATVRLTSKGTNPFSRRLLGDVPEPSSSPEPPVKHETADLMAAVGEIFRHNAEAMRQNARAARFAALDDLPGRREEPPAPAPPREVTLNVASIDLPPLETPPPPPPRPKPFRHMSLAEYLKENDR